jgi:hypothetical protein
MRVIVKGFHWTQIKTNIYDEIIYLNDYNDKYFENPMDGGEWIYGYSGYMDFQLKHWPLTTAEVIVQFINASLLGPEHVGGGEWYPGEGMYNAHTWKFHLDKYQNIWYKNLQIDGMDVPSLNIWLELDFGSGQGWIEVWREEGMPEWLMNQWRVEVKVVYTPVIGSYEWIAVGRNAIPGIEPTGGLNVDAVGASLVAEAFDSLKNIPVRWAALDMADPWTLLATSLLRQFDPDDYSVQGYEYGPDDPRMALKNDWSSTVPISSANIISVGGPGARANKVSEYFNEFMPALYRGGPWFHGIDEFWGELRDIFPVSDYGFRQGTGTTMGPYNIDAAVHENKGYAVVATYLDINGTEGFIVYGLTGNDTFTVASAMYDDRMTFPIYKMWPAEWWSYPFDDIDSQDKLMAEPVEMSLIEYLQHENPGVTAIIIEINYGTEDAEGPPPPDMPFTGDIHPTLTIVEQLGTISEKPQHDP